jgi:carbon-monoxide dehydrogenase small subunit
MNLTITVNGRKRQLETPPDRRLIDILREDLHLTGTKEGCGSGECGACTVLMNGQPVNTCLIWACQIDGADITTIEGITPETGLHPIQEAFVQEGAIQCGFCTPGVILTTVAFLSRNRNPSVEDIRSALSGNLCRCTGYTKIFQAVVSAAEKLRANK